MSNNNTNILLSNRSQLTSRQSIEALISYARDQDQKIYTRQKRFAYGKALTVYALCSVPLLYFAYNLSFGYWRKIYSTGPLSSSIEAAQGNVREYFVPEMYLKEREVRKIELGLKDTQQLRTLFRKRPQA